MSDANEGLKIAENLQTYSQAQTAEQTKSCLRTKKMVCSTVPDGEVIGVKEALGGSYEMQIPYYSPVCDATVGDVVWIEYDYNNMSTAKAKSIAPMFGGNFWTNIVAKTAMAIWTAIKSQAFSEIYPVGSIYCSISPTSPATLFGGVWATFGAGRVLVGVDGVTYTEPEEIGGANSVYLTVDNLASHYHSPDVSVSVNGGGAHAHGYTKGYTGYSTNAVGSTAATRTAVVSLSGGGTDTTGSGGSRPNVGVSVTIGNTGGNQAHENRMPYVTCYMWKRIG